MANNHIICFVIFILLLSGTIATNVIILSVHIGASPLNGYYLTSPAFDVATRDIRVRFPSSLSNLSHIAVFMGRDKYELCQTSGDHTAELFSEYYYRNMDWLNAPGNYLVIASPGNEQLVLNKI
jgi:hypothetical protein